MKTNAILFLVATLAAAAPALAARDQSRDGGRNEHDLAREALARGDVLPIARILAIVAQRVPGEVVEVKLDERRERLFYQVKVLTSSGVVREVHLDPKTGVITREEDD
jgi:uncharacterized membrane protein YkoI